MKLQPHNCEQCGKALEPKAYELQSSYGNRQYNQRRFCDRLCQSNHRRSQTALKPKRKQCSVPGCSHLVGENLRFLCTTCYENDGQIEEIKTGVAPGEENLSDCGSIEPVIQKMRENLTKRATILNAKDFTQEELQYYLKRGHLPPTKRRA